MFAYLGGDMTEGKVAVIGSLNVDLVTRTARLPGPGETVAGDSFETVSGGKGANQALAAARAGAAVKMIGAVGSDHHAPIATAFLKAAGVDLDGVRTVEGPTGIAQIAVDHRGENTIIVVAGANGVVRDEDAVSAVGVLARGDAILLQMEIPASVDRAALTAAKAAGVTSIFNTAPYTDAVPELAAMADIVVCNETEFDLLAATFGVTGTREANARDLAARNGQTFLVTLGKDGAFVATADGIEAVPSVVVDAVDTVGAGDTFCGYVAAELSRGAAVAQAARLACVAAALSCTKPGAQTGIPVLAEVKSFNAVSA